MKWQNTIFSMEDCLAWRELELPCGAASTREAARNQAMANRRNKLDKLVTIVNAF